MREALLSESSCLNANWAALEAYQGLREASAIWQATEQRLGRVAPQAASLLQDLFVSFYDPSTELNIAVDHVLSWNFSFLAQLFATQEFKALSEQTWGDSITSACAALHVADVLMEAFRSRETAGPKRLVQRIWRTLGGRGVELGLGLPVSGGETEQRFVAGRAARRAQAGVATDQVLRASWGIRPGIRGAHAFDDVWKLLEEIRQLDGFAELTDALGRFRNILKPFASERSRRQGRAGVSRIAGYTSGDNLDRAAPEEVVRLLDPEMEGLFYEAFDHRRLLQHDVKGESKRATGPIICCMDTSASMNALAALERERFLWSKGLALALLDYAASVGRPFLGICFSSEADLEAFAFPVGEYTPRRALDMAKCDFNGGTHFERPLRFALEHAEGMTGTGTNSRANASFRAGGQTGLGAPGVDVVFVADGEASLRAPFCEEFRRRKALLRLHLHTVLIDGYHPGLAALSDCVYTVRSDRIDSWEGVVAGLGRRLQ